MERSPAKDSTPRRCRPASTNRTRTCTSIFPRKKRPPPLRLRQSFEDKQVLNNQHKVEPKTIDKNLLFLEGSTLMVLQRTWSNCWQPRKQWACDRRHFSELSRPSPNHCLTAGKLVSNHYCKPLANQNHDFSHGNFHLGPKKIPGGCSCNLV